MASEFENPVSVAIVVMLGVFKDPTVRVAVVLDCCQSCEKTELDCGSEEKSVLPSGESRKDPKPFLKAEAP